MNHPHCLRLVVAKGIAPSADGIFQFLRNLHPGEDLHGHIRLLVQQLGSDAFQERELATVKLTALGAGARKELTQAVEGNDPEIRYRAKAILKRTSEDHNAVMLAAFEVIKQKQLSGGANVVLKSIPICQQEFLRVAAAEALSATVRQDDLELLESASGNGPVEVRAAAIVALERAAGVQSLGLLRVYLRDDGDLVQLAAARAVAMHAPREYLTVLVDLLESDQVKVRIRSAATLRRLTGERFGFVGGYEHPKFRQEAVDRWRSWLAEYGATATLRTP